MLWTHRIANLIPLPRQKNSEAQNYDFELKKEKYFKGRYGTSSYALTTQVLRETTWTPAILEKRQKELLSIFVEKWELENDSDMESTPENSQMVNERMKNFRFSDYGIPIGSELTFFRKPTIKCIVADGNNKVQYNGMEYSLSGLAKKLLSEQSGKNWKSARGADHFQYNGQKLSDMTRIQQKN